MSVAQGLRTLSNLMSEHSLVAITLPHSKMGAEQKAQVVFDPCSYPLTSVKLNELVEPTTGIDAVRVYDTDGLLALSNTCFVIQDREDGFTRYFSCVRKADARKSEFQRFSRVELVSTLGVAFAVC